MSRPATEPSDLLITGASLLGRTSADVLVREGTIAAVGPDAATDAAAGTPRVDGDGLVLLPGFVDLHTHLREPGREDTETVLTGSQVPMLRSLAMAALATLAMIAPQAPDLLAPARAALDEPGVTGTASAPPGRLVIRLLARDDWPLRRQIHRLLTVLRPDPLPRVWQV